jgi:hypothetical protein
MTASAAQEERQRLIETEEERLRPRPLTSAEVTPSLPDSREQTAHRIWPSKILKRLIKEPKQ